jgi:hypothetical protein
MKCEPFASDIEGPGSLKAGKADNRQKQIVEPMNYYPDRWYKEMESKSTYVTEAMR